MHRILALPLGNAGKPLRILLRLRRFIERGEHLLHVGDNAQIGGFVLVDFGVVDVDVNDLRPDGERLRIPGHAVVKAGAERDQKVALVGRVVGVDGAVHAEPAQRKRVIVRNRADSHQRGHHRNVVPLGEPDQLRGSLRTDDSAAGVDAGAAAGGDHLLDLRHRGRIQLRLRVVALERDRRIEVGHDPLLLNVLRNIHHHRPRPPAGGDQKRLAHHPGDVVRVEH